MNSFLRGPLFRPLSALFVVNVLQQVLKCLSHVIGSNSRCLNEHQPILVSELLSSVFLNFSSGRRGLDDVCLCADKHDGEVRLSKFLQLLDPFRHILVTFLVCDVVDY